MYHPYIVRYVEHYNRHYGAGTYNEEDTLQVVKDALHNHREIMGLNWVMFSRILFGPHDNKPVFSNTFTNGWDFSEDTKALRRVFEEMAYPRVLGKKLEDYL